MKNGADKNILTEEGERPLDLVEPTDFATIKVMLGDTKRRSSPRPEPVSSDEDDDDDDDNNN